MIDPDKELEELPPLEGEYLGPEPDEDEKAEVVSEVIVAQQLMKAAMMAPPEPVKPVGDVVKKLESVVVDKPKSWPIRKYRAFLAWADEALD